MKCKKKETEGEKTFFLFSELFLSFSYTRCLLHDSSDSSSPTNAGKVRRPQPPRWRTRRDFIFLSSAGNALGRVPEIKKFLVGRRVLRPRSACPRQGEKK